MLLFYEFSVTYSEIDVNKTDMINGYISQADYRKKQK